MASLLSDSQSESHHCPKTIIICCDGTWQNSNYGWQKGFLGLGPGHPVLPTNVTHLSRAIPPENPDGRAQIIYYQAGVGSSWSNIEQIWGGTTGEGLGYNIREAYAFLVNNYVDGDSIVLIGFSRGAFTARSIAGLVADFGLLDKSKDGMRYFYNFFCDWENAGEEDYEIRIKQDLPQFDLGTDEQGNPVTASDVKNYILNYRTALGDRTRAVDIEAVGVFDTVGALGIPILPLIWRLFPRMPRFFRSQYRFYDTGLSNRIKNAFHALALDERRAAFSPAVWEKLPGCTTNLEQVWFSGTHSSAGGGYHDTSASDISLAWMMQKLRPFVHFSKSYLETEIVNNRTFYVNQQSLEDSDTSISLSGRTWRWGLGILYNSNVFPTCLGGKQIRRPGFCQRTDYKTGQSTQQLLSDTNEKIHPSVRARYEFGGLDWRGNPYKSQGLEDWSLQGETWVYTGSDKAGRGPFGTPKTLPESVLSGYELDLLNYDPKMKSGLFGDHS